MRLIAKPIDDPLHIYFLGITWVVLWILLVKTAYIF